MMLLKINTDSYSNNDGSSPIPPAELSPPYCTSNKPSDVSVYHTCASVDENGSRTGNRMPEIPDLVNISSAESTPCSSPQPYPVPVTAALSISTRCANAAGPVVKPNGIYSPSRRLNGLTPVDRIDEDVAYSSDPASIDCDKLDDKSESPNYDSNTLVSSNDMQMLVDDQPPSSDSISSCDSGGGSIHPTPDSKGSRSPFRDRRQTIGSKIPARRLHAKYAGSEDIPSHRKSSLADECWWMRRAGGGAVSAAATLYGDDAQMPPGPIGYRRRMSVPEKSLFNADYAILRKNFESEIEIVGAFHRADSDAYRNFLDSLTCYDLAPQHGVLIMLDAKLTLHKAVTIMCLNAGNRVALINNVVNREDNTGVFTVTDCLHVLQVASRQVKAMADGTCEPPTKKFADETLQHFLDEFQYKANVVSAVANTSIWNVSRLFRINRVHRIPVLDEHIGVIIRDGQLCTTRSTEVISFISLKTIFGEILKLCDSKCALKPNLSNLPVKAVDVGEWSRIATIEESDTFGKAIDILLERKISCLPILRGESLDFVGVLTKDDILDVIAQCGPQSYAEVLEMPIKNLMKKDDDMPTFVTPDASIEAAIRHILNDTKCHTTTANVYRQERQCVYVVDASIRRLVGVISLADIMQFIFTSTNTIVAANVATTPSPPMAVDDDNGNENCCDY